MAAQGKCFRVGPDVRRERARQSSVYGNTLVGTGRVKLHLSWDRMRGGRHEITRQKS